jgi:hypothetical protein
MSQANPHPFRTSDSHKSQTFSGGYIEISQWNVRKKARDTHRMGQNKSLFLSELFLGCKQHLAALALMAPGMYQSSTSQPRKPDEMI